MKRIIFISFLLAWPAWSPQVHAQSANYLGVVVASYERGYYDEVVGNAQKALADTAPYTPSDLVYLRTYLSFSLVALGNDDQAVEVFKIILVSKPKLELNPEFVSPKIISVFKRAQLEVAQSQGQSGVQPGLIFDKGKPKKMPCLWRAALWPGWGQSYRGEIKKGKILKRSALGIAAGLGAVFLGTYLSHQSYLNATDPDVIGSKYDTYNAWYKTRSFGINLAISFWFYSALDIVLTD
ncbi:hypothetical protein HY768_11435 [candidate division TA06 bacterium]|uniref:Tetratricopeptide repeat protein n=1 Tax=candidate division TA06 bacterium TaxID=2250710 RepID=A0A933IAW0_UNCT6|nr:hypothetical protein [candidate division TA06 bacterium]